jgi:hypothetical protein
MPPLYVYNMVFRQLSDCWLIKDSVPWGYLVMVFRHGNVLILTQSLTTGLHSRQVHGLDSTGWERNT